MMIKERTKQEIQAKLMSMGDYVKIDYLGRALNSGLDFETRKFILLELSRLYEGRGMYSEAGKLMKNAAEINTTFKGKTQDYMKSVEMHIKGGDYMSADNVFAQALALATEIEKPGLKGMMKGFYFTQAQAYTRADKRNQAKKAYEKLASLDLNAQEKQDVNKELMALYGRLGNIRDFYKVRDSLSAGH